MISLDLGERIMRRALQLVVDDGRATEWVKPCLTHNDFSAKHILVANGAISGSIDFGEVAGSEPLSDLVRWDYYDAARFPFTWLQEGYADKRVFDADFTRRLHIKRIAFSLWVMRWYTIQPPAASRQPPAASCQPPAANVDRREVRDQKLLCRRVVSATSPRRSALRRTS